MKKTHLKFSNDTLLLRKNYFNHHCPNQKQAKQFISGDYDIEIDHSRSFPYTTIQLHKLEQLRFIRNCQIFKPVYWGFFGWIGGCFFSCLCGYRKAAHLISISKYLTWHPGTLAYGTKGL